MKKIIYLLLLALPITTIAQRNFYDEEEKKGFDLNRMYAGGSLSLGFGSGSFVVGGNPQVGYSLTNWFDVGITTNLIYSSQRYNQGWGELRQRTWNYGGGPFIKIFPFNFIHLQAQYEYNFISGNVELLQTGQKQSFSESVPSLLVGAGYGQRIIGQSSFFMTILFDVTKNDNSPYVLAEGQGKIAMPVVRSGFIVYFRKKNQ